MRSFPGKKGRPPPCPTYYTPDGLNYANLGEHAIKIVLHMKWMRVICDGI